LEHRAALNALGFVNGFQWCDGSFVEDKDPSDMDVVVFVHPPGELSQLVQQHLHLFDPALTRQSTIVMFTSSISRFRQKSWWNELTIGSDCSAIVA
jgi:hypothetical protein